MNMKKKIKQISILFSEFSKGLNKLSQSFYDYFRNIQTFPPYTCDRGLLNTPLTCLVSVRLVQPILIYTIKESADES